MRAPARRRNTSSTRGGYESCLQYSDGGRTRVARVEDDGAVLPLARVETTYQLARKADRPSGARSSRSSAREAVEAPIAYAELLRDGRLLPPLTHPDPAHCLVSGTGLTHLGSAAARDSMHAEARQTGRRAHRLHEDVQVGSRRRQARGQQAGHAARVVLQGQRRATWSAVAQPLASPDFAEDHGEEPELVGLLHHRRQRPAAPPRVRHRQRVLRPRDRAPQLSTAGAFETAPVRRRARC